MGALDRRAEPGQVALVDDLAHAGAQRLGEHAGVDAAADQDDADRGPGHPEVVGEGGGRLEVDRRAEHDGVLVGRLGERPLQLVEVGDDLGCRPR